LGIINAQPKNGDYVFSTASGKHYSYAKHSAKEHQLEMVKAT